MNQTVLLAPHNDDETLWATFQILRARPYVIVCFRSDVQERRGYTWDCGAPNGVRPLITCVQRELETAAAMSILGVDWEQWEYLDSIGGVYPELGERIEELAGDHYHCIAPAYEAGGHKQHNLIAYYARRFFGQDRTTSYRSYTKWNGKSADARKADFEPHWPALKLRALACYESQIQHPSTRDHFLREQWEYIL